MDPNVKDAITIFVFMVTLVLFPICILFDIPHRLINKYFNGSLRCTLLRKHTWRKRDDGAWYAYLPWESKMPGQILVKIKSKGVYRLERHCKHCEQYEYCSAPGIWSKI